MLFKEAVLRIHRIHMLLGLPDPDPLVRGMDPDPDPALDPDPVPSIIMQKNKKTLIRFPRSKLSAPECGTGPVGEFLSSTRSGSG